MVNRMTIEIYTREKTFVHAVSGACVMHCPNCDAEVLMLDGESAARVFPVLADRLTNLLESGMLHMEVTASASPGAPLICCNSLFTAANYLEKEAQLKHHA